jgi:signal transduction histidine kinase
MAFRSISQQLQRSILVYSTLITLVIGAIIAAVSIVPLYNTLKRDQQRNLLFALKTRTFAIDEYLSRTKDIALQIASRTRVRNKLEAYNRGEISRTELVEFSQPILKDALKQSRELVGINRLDQRGELVVQVGLAIPEKFRSIPNLNSNAVISPVPLVLAGQSYLVVKAPIINPQGMRVGTDIVLFQLSHLQEIMADYTGLGETGEMILGMIHNEQVQLFFPLRGNHLGAMEPMAKDSVIGSAIEKAVGKHTGILSSMRSAESSVRLSAHAEVSATLSHKHAAVIAYGPVINTDWGILVKINPQELYAPVCRQIFITGSVIVILILLGSKGMVVLLRPLTGKMIIHTDELERLVQELHREMAERQRAETEIKLLNETLETSVQERTAQLEATNKELDSFSYSVSHDLRAPLRRISGFVDALRLQLQRMGTLNEPKIAHYLEVIGDSSHNMGQLIDGLLTLSRLGRRQLQKKSVNLGILVESAIALVRSQISDEVFRSIEFEIGELPTVMGDATLLQQVFTNLIDNAVKFSRDRQPARIAIGKLEDGTIFIKDNGVGFDMEYADQLFAAFQRLHSQKAFEGTGIGLAIVQRIIHRHGGTIWAESQPDQGATFYFKLGQSPEDK